MPQLIRIDIPIRSLTVVQRTVLPPIGNLSWLQDGEVKFYQDEEKNLYANVIRTPDPTKEWQKESVWYRLVI